MADVKKIIADLGKTDWGKDNEAQMKAVQLLKGLALSEEPESNMFMKALSDASTDIAKAITSKEEKKDESVVDKSNTILEGMDDMEKPTSKIKQSSTISRANDLL